MCKCIYCNSTDLTISDIISCALTGKKLTRRFVCREHNAFTNYNLSKSFVENIEVIFGQENPIFHESSVENTKYIRSLESLHEQGTLTKYIENELLVFNQIQQ